MTAATVRVSDRQLRVLVRALEVFARLGTGQLEILIERMTTPIPIAGRPSEDVDDDLRAALRRLKLLATSLDSHASHSIASDAVQEDAKVAYDLLQVLRRHDAETRGLPEWHIARSEPMRVSTREEFAVVRAES